MTEKKFRPFQCSRCPRMINGPNEFITIDKTGKRVCIECAKSIKARFQAEEWKTRGGFSRVTEEDAYG